MRVFVFLLFLWPTHAAAQGAATLVADNVTLTKSEQLVADGNVEVLFQGNRLTASQITYDGANDRLVITGPIIIQSADGTILTADTAQIDPRLENGILQGARLVLDQRLQLAATQIDRVDGQYSQLYKTVATSCQVCGESPPLWDIRAERVVHDEDAHQLYFENAIFRIHGVPLIWLPRMRLPDPTLDRANGFLVPEQRNSTLLGTGIAVPYFITLGDHADVTATPYVSSETTTLELSYRQAFANGDLTAEGAISDDTLEDENRAYIFAEGNFTFDNSYQLKFDVEATSDKSYLSDYSYSSQDRLDSAINVLRVTDSTLFDTSVTYYQTLRDDESNATLPPIVADLSYEARVQPAIGGVLSIAGSVDSAYRYSNEDGDDGRDVSRAGVAADWEFGKIIDNGIVANTAVGLRTDYYVIDDDSTYPDNALRVAPTVSTTLRWPLAKTASNGASHLIEPTVMVAWSDAYGDDIPNEDSTRSEFDQSNLFDTSRFAGEDSVETGHQAALGVTWTRLGYTGLSSLLTVGRVARSETLDDFTSSSGLDGEFSDWLVAGQILAPNGLVFDTRALFDDDTGITRGAGLLSWQNDAVSLSAAYIWQAKDADEDRTDTVSEWTLSGAFDINDTWSTELDARYDVAEDEPVSAGLGLEWRNECVTINLSASRRYTSSSTVDPSTNYGISGTVNGFSSGRTNNGPAAGCKNER